MWTIEYNEAGKKDFRKYEQKHRCEFAACFRNLERLRTQFLDKGKVFGGIDVGYLHNEKHGMYAIGQTGVAHAKETRLYIYPDSIRKVIHVLLIGDKDSQANDIERAHELAKDIINGGEHDDDTKECGTDRSRVDGRSHD